MDTGKKDLTEKYDRDGINLAEVIENIPANVFFKDTECRYQIASHVCQMLNTGGNPDFTIYGKTDLEIQPDPELGQKFYNEDKQIIATGQEMSYLQKMTFGEDDYYYEIHKRPVPGPDGKPGGIIGMITDMTEHVKMQKELESFAMHDNLTGIYNRTYFVFRKKELLEKGKFPVAFLVADCDNLKTTNDTYGHKSGDYLIQATVGNLKLSFPDETDIIRLGGDEFLLVIEGCDEAHCKKYIETFLNREKTTHSGEVIMSTSIGYHIVKSPEENLEGAIDAADAMMYEVKRKKKAEEE